MHSDGCTESDEAYAKAWDEMVAEAIMETEGLA